MPPNAFERNKQKEGKKCMLQFGKVAIPQETIVAVLKVDV